MNKRNRIGSENPLFANGKTVSHGYVVLCSKVWGKNQERYEHRVVMESILNRPLSNTELVHHKNGNPLDNRPDNLELVSRLEHNRLHGDGQLLQCSRCGAQHWYNPSMLAKMNSSDSGYLCRRCALKHLYTKRCKRCGCEFQGGMQSRFCSHCTTKARGKGRQGLSKLEP